jgi:antagonist of KipI
MTKPEVILQFQKPGLQTTIQDLGRNGFQSLGVPVSGAMDEFSAKVANWLVGNPVDFPVFEITMIGPKIQFSEKCQIAVTGANLNAEITGTSIEMNETINIQRGEVLSFGKLNFGCRTYLAVRGNWQVKKWLKSASNTPQNGEILTPESYVRKGHSIKIISKAFIPKRTYPKNQTPSYPALQIIRVVPGPEFDSFNKFEIAKFFSQNHKITSESNRMGYRLSTQLPDNQKIKGIISSGVIPGTIQITNAGKAIILMKDAQTTGGYARFLNVVLEDMDRLGQMKPGEEIRFQMVDF